MVIKASNFHNAYNHTPTQGNYTQAFISSAQLNATSQAVLFHVHFYVRFYMLVCSCVRLFVFYL